MISKLIEAGADVNITDKYRYTPLMAAIRAGIDLNITGNCRKVSSMALCKQVDTVRLLLREGADVNLRNNNGAPALLFAAIHKEIAILKMLIEAGADVNVTVLDAHALVECAVTGLSQHSKLLIEAGANVNFISYKEATALHHFAYSNDFPRVQQLLRAGAHVNKNNGQQNNAVRYYIEYRKESKINRNMAKLLFAAGDHVGIHDNRGSRRRTHYFMPASALFLNSIVRVPEFLRRVEQEELNLMSMCRAAVRHYMLRASNLNLFMRVPTLEIPCVLMDYLLYDMSVEKDYDRYEDKNNIGDDDSDTSSHSDEDDNSDDGNDDDNSDSNSGGHGDAYSDDGSQDHNHSDNGSWNSFYSSGEPQYYNSHSNDDSLGPDYDPFKSDDEY